MIFFGGGEGHGMFACFEQRVSSKLGVRLQVSIFGREKYLWVVVGMMGN